MHKTQRHTYFHEYTNGNEHLRSERRSPLAGSECGRHVLSVSCLTLSWAGKQARAAQVSRLGRIFPGAKTTF